MIIKTKSWECKVCEFNWDLPPNVEPTQEVADVIFNTDNDYLRRVQIEHKNRDAEAILKGQPRPEFPRLVGAFECPNCIIQGINGNILTETFDRTTKTIRSEEDIDNDIKLSVKEKTDLKKKIREDIAKYENKSN